jgi:hypothetical protein
MEDVHIGSLLAHQTEDVTQVLTSVVAELDKRAADHKAVFMNERLSNTFPDTLGYAFEKVGDAIRGSMPREVGVWGIEAVEKAMGDFRAALGRRDMELDTFDTVASLYDELGYAIAELKKYLRAEPSDVPNARMAGIVSHFVYRKVDELRDIAREIDEDYAAD